MVRLCRGAVLSRRGRGSEEEVRLRLARVVDVDVGITGPAGAAFTSPRSLPASGQRPRPPYSALRLHESRFPGKWRPYSSLVKASG